MTRAVDDVTRTRLMAAVRRVCPEWLRDQQDDLVQMTAMKLIRSNAESDWSDTYLSRVAYTVVVDEMRRRKRRREVGMSPSLPHRMRDSDNLSPEASARGSELGDGLLDCLAELPEEKQLAVTLYLQDHTVPEIADHLGWDRKRVSNLVYRGLDDLRSALRRRGLEP